MKKKNSPYETAVKNFFKKQLTVWKSLHSPSITLITLKKSNRNTLVFLHTHN